MPPLRVAVTMTQLDHRVPGGTATSVERLVDRLRARDDVDPVEVRAAGDLRRPRTWRGARPAGTVRVPLPVPVLYDAWARTGRPRIESSTGPVDLVHVTVPLPVGVGDTTVVATVHDLFPLTRPRESTRRGAELMAAGLRWIDRTAAAVMVPSEVVAEECRRHGIGAGRLHVVPWGVDVPVVDDAASARVRGRYGLVDPYVCTVGTVEPRKNLDGLLAAMALLDRPDLTLAVVGPPGWGADPFAASPHAGPVARLGRVPQADLAPIMAGAAAVCLPSHEEGFGMAVLEAMAAGAVVVTSRGTATEEVAGDAAVLVDPADPSDIAAALARVLDDGDLSGSLRARAVERAAGCTWEHTAQLAAEVYRAAAGGGAVRGRSPSGGAP